MNFDFKNGRKINLKIVTKNHAGCPEIGFLIKSISVPYVRATAMPPAWVLNKCFLFIVVFIALSYRFSFDKLELRWSTK